MFMKGVIDHYLVELDCLYEKSPIVGGIGQDQMFTKMLSENNEILFNPNKFKRTYGKILSPPAILSNVIVDDRDGNTERMNEVYCTLLKAGDTAHFFWTATQPEMIVSEERTYEDSGKIKMRYIFRIPAHRIICSSDSDGNITVNGDYILLKPIMQEESEIKTASGIWLAETTEERYLQATITHSNCNLKHKKVLYTPHSNPEVEINGDTFYAMRQTYILAVLGEYIIPIGTKAIVEMEPEETHYPNGIEIPECFRKKQSKGIVARIGSECEEISVGDNIRFQGFAVEVEYQGKKEAMIREGQVMFKVF